MLENTIAGCSFIRFRYGTGALVSHNDSGMRMSALFRSSILYDLSPRLAAIATDEMTELLCLARTQSRVRRSGSGAGSAVACILSGNLSRCRVQYHFPMNKHSTVGWIVYDVVSFNIFLSLG